jgi:hypothetical protein
MRCLIKCGAIHLYIYIANFAQLQCRVEFSRLGLRGIILHHTPAGRGGTATWVTHVEPRFLCTNGPRRTNAGRSSFERWLAPVAGARVANRPAHLPDELFTTLIMTATLRIASWRGPQLALAFPKPPGCRYRPANRLCRCGQPLSDRPLLSILKRNDASRPVNS